MQNLNINSRKTEISEIMKSSQNLKKLETSHAAYLLNLEKENIPP